MVHGEEDYRNPIGILFSIFNKKLSATHPLRDMIPVDLG
jgi:hypothetical protein